MRAVLDFRGSDCLNPLDHIYGFTHLMRKFKREITPNHRTSTFDLVMQCLGNVRRDALLWVRRLLGALRMTSTQPEIQATLDFRREESMRWHEQQDLSLLSNEQMSPRPAGNHGGSFDSSSEDEGSSRRGYSLQFIDKAHVTTTQKCPEVALVGISPRTGWSSTM